MVKHTHKQVGIVTYGKDDKEYNKAEGNGELDYIKEKTASEKGPTKSDYKLYFTFSEIW